MRFGSIVGLGLSLCVFGCTASNPGALDAGADSGADAQVATCGNGKLDPGEQCDDGNLMNGDGCQADCTFTCIADNQCDDKDPCNGAETCTSQHTCMAGTALADGTACGSGQVCKGGACMMATCGDGIVTAPEECDDGNATNGDGCDNDCKWSCVSTDKTRNCTPKDACAGQGTCNDTTHVCTAGTPITDGTACPQNAANYCKAGVCTMPVCGNGTLEPGEQCDDGNMTNGDGCNNDCKYSCVNPATDCGAAPACNVESCDASHKCAAVADPTQDGKSCNTNMVCKSGACVAPSAVCGNGIVEAGEDCDFGSANNGPGTGCESNCKFSCTTSPNSCDDGNPCNGVETCGSVTVAGKMGQKCSPGTPAKDGTSCGGKNICISSLCKAPTCGDGIVTPPEQCDPSNGTTCVACMTVTCGNGIREGNEQCDDHNLTNLDGCDSTCKFEQDQRANSLTMLFATDTYCTSNRLGGAIVSSLGQSQLQTSLDTGIKDGSTTILLRMLGLDDLTGTADAAVNIGVVTGAPATAPSGVTYDGTSDVDWWYTADASGLDAMRIPTAQIAGAISGKQLSTTKNGNVTLNLILGGSPASLRMTNTKLQATIGNSTTPTASTTMMTPGHLASENLDPTLQSYQTSTSGELCGNVSAASLAQVPIPMALAQNCDQGYVVGTNHLLDALVNGCTAFGIVTVISPTQPDSGLDDPSAPPAGAGPPYQLVVTGNQVTGCQDKNGATVTKSACLADAVYSSAFDFTTDRVIIK